jgi:hypothetical protein
VTLKYWNKDNIVLETDPDQNFLYYEQQNPEEARRLLQMAEFRNLQTGDD